MITAKTVLSKTFDSMTVPVPDLEPALHSGPAPAKRVIASTLSFEVTLRLYTIDNSLST